LQQYLTCFGISNLLLSFLLVVNLEMKQIIVKEKGIFTNVISPTTKAKLRLLFEVAPLGLLIENAGGHSSDGKQSVLDKVVTNTDDRTQVAYGSKNEIIRFEETLYGTSRLAAELASASA
jgi:sedoheptulose-bisphosphatase